MDKMCHSNEFRLRLLVTDTCNLNCDYCLNDFQKKRDNILSHFLNIEDSINIARKYIQFIRFLNNQTPIITISGGEPGLYPDLFKLIQSIKTYDEDVKIVICSNGRVFAHPYWNVINDYIDYLHIHIFPGTFINFNKLVTKTPVVQVVFTDDIDDDSYEDLIQYYHSIKIKIKLFVDFYGDKSLMKRYEKFINLMNMKYDNVLSRFTGIQENRGIGCFQCDKKCITLKGLWVFANGKISACPQVPQEDMVDYKDIDISSYILKAYDFHKIGGK